MKLVMSDRSLNVSFEDTGDNIKYIDLSELKIANCIGCFGCWTKTPGKCVIRDDAVKVYPAVAESEKIIYVSHIRYGSYDTAMKTMLERTVPVQTAFIRLYNGETHHVQRSVAPKKAVIVAYGDISDEEKKIFKKLIERNSHNMIFETYEVIFTEEKNVDEVVKKEVEKWGK